LAGPGRSHDRGVVPALQLDADPLQRDDLRLPASVHLPYVDRPRCYRGRRRDARGHLDCPFPVYPKVPTKFPLTVGPTVAPAAVGAENLVLRLAEERASTTRTG